MPLPDTHAYRLQLEALHALSPACAELGKRIGTSLRPEVLVQASSTSAGEMYAHMNAIGLQRPGSVNRLGAWLYRMVVLKALSQTEATAFLRDATALGGPSGVASAKFPSASRKYRTTAGFMASELGA